MTIRQSNLDENAVAQIGTVVAEPRRLRQINVMAARQAQYLLPAFSPTCRWGVRALPRWPSRGWGLGADASPGLLLCDPPECQQPRQDTSHAVTDESESMVVGDGGREYADQHTVCKTLSPSRLVESHGTLASFGLLLVAGRAGT